jgi:replication fork clamp-binding protein CrfC
VRRGNFGPSGPKKQRVTRNPSRSRLQNATALLELATRTEQLVNYVSRESKTYQRAGRLNRLVQFRFSDLNEEEVTDFAEAHVDIAKENPSFGTDPEGFYLLQSAIAQASYRLWERMWDQKHPDKTGKAWEGQDASLFSIWRQQLLLTIEECHQTAALKMNSAEYIAKLIAGGASNEAADHILGWLLIVRSEEYRTTEVVHQTKS